MIDRFNAFMVLAREQHFGRAAAALGITQPSLSSSLRALEDQLGIQLVRRGSRLGGLTPEGERVLDWARRIVGDARAMQAEMRALRQDVTGRLRIGVIPSAMPRIAELTAPFLARHPATSVAILSRSSDEIRDQIAALELDAGVTYLDAEPLGRVQGLALYRETYCLVDRGAAGSGVREGDMVRVASRAGDTTLRARITERVAPGVVYTTFHHPNTQANVVTTDNSDWATNCPEFKVTAVQVSLSNGASEWQEQYRPHADLARRILPAAK